VCDLTSEIAPFIKEVFKKVTNSELTRELFKKLTTLLKKQDFHYVIHGGGLV
jgi:hypothetical protein